MKIYHVETQEAYDTLMSELEEKGCKWLGGNKPTEFDCWERNKGNTCINILDKDIGFGFIEKHKKEHPNIPIIKYKAKGEEMTQEEMKQKLKKNIFEIYGAIDSFARGISEAEADLKEAKSSAKKLIEKIDDYLESQKPKFKVGDYAVELGKYITKIEKIDDGMPKGCFYMPGNNHFFPIKDSVSSYIARYATPEEIAEYESALQFHKHGRKPFELKRGDVVYLKGYDKNIFLDSGNIYKKHNFIDGDVVFVKTAEEVNDWLENK